MRFRSVLALAVASGFVALSASLAIAAGSQYGAWTLSGATPNWSGTMNVPAAGFPAATYTANSNTPTLASGDSAFLGPQTPFGAAFGSSQGQGYLLVPTGPGTTPSTTTVTFAGPTPAAGWGFALGDIDADMVQITATGPSGPFSPAALGWQSAFNYCGVSPQPSSCANPPFTDVPTWNPATGTLTGNVADTSGAAGWFRPTQPVTSLTFTFTPLSGIPVFQIWFAAATADITGTVQLQTPGGPVPPPPGSTLLLQTPTGDPVLDANGNPITATPGPDGSYLFDEVVAAMYQVTVVPPPGYDVVGPASKPADATTGRCMVDFLLEKKPPVTTTTAPPPPMPPTTVPGPQLPKTGSSTGFQLGLAALFLGGGVLLVRQGRRLRPRHLAR